MYSSQTQKSACDYTFGNQQLKSQQYDGYVSSVSGHNQLGRPVLSSVHGEENPYLADRQLFNQDKSKFSQPTGQGEGSYHSLFAINTPNLEKSSGQYHSYFNINTPQQQFQNPQHQQQQQFQNPQQPQQQFQIQQQPQQQQQQFQNQQQQFQNPQQPQQQQFQNPQQPQQQQTKPIWQFQQTDQSSWKPQQQDMIFNRTMDMGGNKQPSGYNPAFMDRVA